MTTIINAELLAIGSIPLAAALMARGVGYADWFPWQVGAGFVVAALGGLGYKYVKEGTPCLPPSETLPTFSRTQGHLITMPHSNVSPGMRIIFVCVGFLAPPAALDWAD